MLCLLPNHIQIIQPIKYITILPVFRFTSSTSQGTHFPLDTTPPLIRLSLSLAETFPLKFSLAVSWYYFPQHHRCSSSSCLATHTETTLGTALILWLKIFLAGIFLTFHTQFFLVVHLCWTTVDRSRQAGLGSHNILHLSSWEIVIAAH